MIASSRRPAAGRLLLTTALLVASAACTGDADEQQQATPTSGTPSPTADAPGSPSPSASPTGSPRSQMQGVLSREDFGIPWSVEIVDRDGGWCMTARAEGESQEVCGDEVTLDELSGGQEVISAVELSVGTLDITAGLVVEGVARVRVVTEPPPENPGGDGAMEEVEPQDALEGLNAYAEADQDPTQGAGDDLATERVVAFDLTGDQVGEVTPAS